MENRIVKTGKKQREKPLKYYNKRAGKKKHGTLK
jgi:hypothetical protein